MGKNHELLAAPPLHLEPQEKRDKGKEKQVKGKEKQNKAEEKTEEEEQDLRPPTAVLSAFKPVQRVSTSECLQDQMFCFGVLRN